MQNSRIDIDMDTRLATNPNLVLRIEDDNCALLFDPDNGRVQMLNGTAVQIWQLLDGKRSLGEIIEHLRTQFEGIGKTAEQQVIRLAETLADLGAVGFWEQD